MSKKFIETPQTQIAPTPSYAPPSGTKTNGLEQSRAGLTTANHRVPEVTLDRMSSKVNTSSKGKK